MNRTTRAVLLALALPAATGMAPGAASAARADAARQSAAPAASAPGTPRAAPACPVLMNHTMNRLQDDAPQDLCQYAGRVVLVVNTASYCGFTHQYEGLEKLYARYRERGLVVLGFPSNDFGRQEPGSSKQIAEFCENTFGVRFPMFAKTRVAGVDAHPLFVALARETGAAPRWNFHKYLLSREGKPLASYASATDPLDRKVLQAVEAALAEAPHGQR